MIPCGNKLVSWQNYQISHQKTIFKAEDLIYAWNSRILSLRSSLQFHPSYITFMKYQNISTSFEFGVSQYNLFSKLVT